MFTPITDLAREWRAFGGQEQLYRVLRNRNHWGLRLKVWYSRLAVVRPLTPGRVEAVRASSDEGAIFELLAEVGGRMPGREVRP